VQIRSPGPHGSPKAALSGFTKNGNYYSVTEQIGQRSGNEAADAIEAGEDHEKVLKCYPDPDPDSGE
jgi:hypothetical protein